VVRFPRGWVFHPQAARRGSSQLAWRPGWAGTGQQPIVPVPVSRYRRLITGVPINGGQAQGTIVNPTQAGPVSGSVTSPAQYSVIAALVFPETATYVLSWDVSLDGTLSSAETDNFALYLNGETLEATSVNPDTAGNYPQAQVTVAVTAGWIMYLGNPAAGTDGAVYSGTMSAVQQGSDSGAVLSVGPQGLGTVWYPAQVTISTTTGALDTSTALVYCGPPSVLTPATLVGTVYSGNGTVGLAVPSLSPGQVVTAAWTGAHPGDQAAVNIIGTMDALTTG